MATDFGFMAGDQITAIGGFKTRDMNDSEDARNALFEAKLRQSPVTVLRNGNEMQITAK
jgi:membrane-associated protease RseP (regulator of RpoE activity)